ncbi:hypothetical protein D9615_009586 [Tricholomella constricta]|uniref:Uncharacterized protein n=1 Tax=Tricholomella constricta TaxID=117010 RepID=A0A8H5GV61_9AGAR|nr:hypothetical protein D9615_009586 [Tricholomella constricta]
MAQPRLFQGHLSIRTLLASTTHRIFQPDSHKARCYKRLQFFSSPRIARHIRSFSLIPFTHCPFRRTTRKQLVPENDVIDKIFSALPLFTNLRSLVVHFIRLTPRIIAILQDLTLDNFELNIRGHDIWQGLPTEKRISMPLPARRVILFNCDANYYRTPIIPSLFSVHLVHPGTLEEIHSGPDGTQFMLIAMSSSPSAFRSLQTLDISVDFISSPQFVPAMYQCPRLAALRLRRSETPARPLPQMAPIPSNILQALVVYHGPPLPVSFATGLRYP